MSEGISPAVQKATTKFWSTLCARREDENAELREAVKYALAMVKHWQADRECNLMPTIGSLAQTEAELTKALKGKP